MATGTSVATTPATAAAVLAALADRAGWAAWVPGVIASRPVQDDHVEWVIDTPAGPAPVVLRFEDGDNGTRFTLTDGRSSPFTSIAGAAEVVRASGAAGNAGDAGDGGTEITFTITIDATPPFPAALVEGIATQAAAGLAGRAVDSATSNGQAPGGPSRSLLRVPMSDGVELAVHHYRTATDVAPVLLLIIPYRKDSAFIPMMAAGFTGAGFHVLVADVRGFGGSVAAYQGLLSEREIADGVELVEWAAGQSFCDGGVGLFGASYCGANQMLIAARRPRGLRCIAPMVGPVDTYRDWTHRGGIPSHTSWGAMTYLRSQQAATARDGLAHYYLDLLGDPLDNDGHRRRSPEYGLDRIEVPALCIGGWHDYFLRATVRTFLGVSSPKRIVVGPWGHGGPAPIDELLPWYRHWLRGEGPDPTTTPVRLYDTGAQEWRDLDEWPRAEAVAWHEWRPFQTTADTGVVTHVDAVMPAANPRPEFMPDPTDSGMSLWGEALTVDAEPFAEPVTVVGPVALALTLTVDGCADLDVHARLSVVAADGTCTQLTEGRLRASHRAVDRARSHVASDGFIIVPWHPHDRAEPIPDGDDIELAVELYPVCRRMAAGERLRLGLTIARADEMSVPAAARLLSKTAVRLALAAG